MDRKKRKSSISERKKEVLASLSALGGTIYDQLDKGTFPAIDMPSRSTDNITYDEKLRQFILGDRRVKRSARNISHVKPFTQLVWAALFSNELAPPRWMNPYKAVQRVPYWFRGR